MDGYHVKLLLILLLCLSVLLLYLTKKLEYARSNLRKSNLYGLPWHSLSNTHSPSIMITYSSTQSMESQAELLYYSDISTLTARTLIAINICYDKTSNCKTADIRLFLHEYFLEISATKYFKMSSSYFYYIPRDNEIYTDETIKYTIFGGMRALALITDAYIEIKFYNFIWSDSSRIMSCMDELEGINYGQYEIYREIKESAGYGIRNDNYRNNTFSTPINTFYTSGYRTDFCLGPSPEPFQRAQRNNSWPSNPCYAANAYPMQKAAERILIEPYIQLRKAILMGSRKYLTGNYFKPINTDEFIFDRNNMKAVLLFWKDNSTCLAASSQCHKFWKAMSKLDVDNLLKIYQNISGYKSIPIGGFKRLPKTLIVKEKGDKLFPERFKINLYYDFSVH